MVEKDTHQIIIKVPPQEIIFVDMIFKACSGLAMLTISHDEKGIIFLDVTEGTHAEVMKIVRELKNRFSVEIIKE